MDRLRQVYNILTGQGQADSHLLVKDNRTNKTYHIPLTPLSESYMLRSEHLTNIRDEEGRPLRLHDPGYKQTLSASSRICYIDSLRGRLEYRGYPIAQLALRSSFLETSFLLIYGELPNKDQLLEFSDNVAQRSSMHVDLQKTVSSFRRDANPVGVLIACLYALSTLHPEANPTLKGQMDIYRKPVMRNINIQILLGVVPTLVARIYRHFLGEHPIQPKSNLRYVQNCLWMLGPPKGELKPEDKKMILKAVQTLWIVHAEHESSCSTAMVRHMSSSGVDVFTTLAAAAGALSGAKHGGASAAVIHMLQSIGSRENIPLFLMEVRQKQRLLFGFGHRIYRDNDPRAPIVRQVVSEIFKKFGKEPLVGLAIELERIALADQYFVTRKLYPNVDFYTAILYHTMGVPAEIFPLLYCIPRLAGWLAHWNELQEDPELKLVRPRQTYQGHGRREILDMSEREDTGAMIETSVSHARVRREAANQYSNDSSFD